MRSIFHSSVKNNQLTFVTLLSLMMLILYLSTGHLNLYEDAGLHRFWLNVFMVNVTFMGDAWFLVGTIAWFWYQRNPVWKSLLCSFLVCLALIQLIHYLLATGSFEIYVEQGQYLFFTDKQQHLAYPGFISSHTAFGLVLGVHLSGWSQSMRHIIFYSILFVIVTISRLYLSSQGWEAIFFGLITGAAAAWTGLYLPIKQQHRKGYFAAKGSLSDPGSGPWANPVPGA